LQGLAARVEEEAILTLRTISSAATVVRLETEARHQAAELMSKWGPWSSRKMHKSTPTVLWVRRAASRESWEAEAGRVGLVEPTISRPVLQQAKVGRVEMPGIQPVAASGFNPAMSQFHPVRL
jgi:hypothetical protein